MTRTPDPRRAEKHRLAAEVHARGLSSAPLRVLRTYKPGVLKRMLRRADAPKPAGKLTDIDRLLQQKPQHWLDQGPEETPLSCPQCFETFGNLILLDGFDLSKEEFLHATETEASIADTREHIPPITVTCPHCQSVHDINRMGVWMFLLLCCWEVMLVDKKAIEVDGGFPAFVRGKAKERNGWRPKGTTKKENQT